MMASFQMKEKEEAKIGEKKINDVRNGLKNCG